MLFLKDASGLSKSTNKLDSILLLCHCSLKLSIINCTASAVYFQFWQKIEVYRSLFCFKSFFDMNHNCQG